jgi:hypothetical protein
MAKKPEDPIRSYGRKSVAARRVAAQYCKCGESRPEALIVLHGRAICAACKRTELCKSTLDKHHPAGSANHRATTAIPVNDHQTLTDAQYDWPKNTWENPERSPMLAGAACIRGYYETNAYLTDELLLWVARLLEALDEVLKERLGADWWDGTKLEAFRPKPKPKH